MKNQREIYEALLAGETLKDEHGRIVNFNDKGTITNIGEGAGYHFNQPWEWQIYKEPKWYENIPEGGVLCWMDYRDGERAGRPFLILDSYTYKNRGFVNYTPLTKQEIQVFMENAPNENLP